MESEVGDPSPKISVPLEGRIMFPTAEAPSGDNIASLPLDADRETEGWFLDEAADCGGVHADGWPFKEPLTRSNGGGIEEPAALRDGRRVSTRGNGVRVASIFRLLFRLALSEVNAAGSLANFGRGKVIGNLGTDERRLGSFTSAEPDSAGMEQCALMA